jgi:hypothetical protein
MSDENQNVETVDVQETPSPAALTEDRFKNYQSEMERKLANQNAQIQALLSSINQPKQSVEPGKKVSVFDDENEYARQIEERAAAKIEAKLAAERAHQQKNQQIINSIVMEYPEANDLSSPLYNKAQEVYASLSDEEKLLPISMKMAVTSAAAELGIKPKSKRSNQSPSDSFSMGSSPKSSGSQKKSDLDANTEAFAQLMGLNTSDPKVRDRLKARKSK